MTGHMQENMCDVGLVTVSGNNYGNNITNLALFTYIKEQGYSVREINMSVAPQLYPENYQLWLFSENPYTDGMLEMVYDRWKINNYNKNTKMFLLGSDQLWRFDMFVMETEYFTCLDWVNKGKYKASYATSFGIDKYEGDPKVFKKFINRFQNISVREEAGLDILKQYTSIQARVVLDPVFLVNDFFYKKLIQKSHFEKKKKYVGAYILDQKEWKTEFIDSISNNILDNEKILITDPIAENSERKYSIEDWLKVIDGSKIFITDSFHGMCMALILKKNFMVLIDAEDKRGRTRIVDLLESLDLKEHIITENSSPVLGLSDAIDYDEVYEKLEHQRSDSKQWLNKILYEGSHYTERRYIEDFICRYRYLKNNVLSKYQKYIFQRECSKSLGGNLRKFEVIVWGAGKCFFYNIKEVSRYLKIEKVCDKNSKKWGEEVVAGIKCVSPDEITWNENIVVIIMMYSRNNILQIKEQIMKCGAKAISIEEFYAIKK